MTARRVELVREVNGEVAVTPTGLALLIGSSVEEVESWWDPSKGVACIPVEWQRPGRRRSAEARAATGSTSIACVLLYWAHRDRGADIDVEEDNSVWLIELTGDADDPS